MKMKKRKLSKTLFQLKENSLLSYKLEIVKFIKINLKLFKVRTSNVNDANQPIDKNLLRSSIILSKTFKYKNNDIEEPNPDMDFFVDPNKVDGNNKVIKFEFNKKLKS